MGDFRKISAVTERGAETNKISQWVLKGRRYGARSTDTFLNTTMLFLDIPMIGSRKI